MSESKFSGRVYRTNVKSPHNVRLINQAIADLGNAKGIKSDSGVLEELLVIGAKAVSLGNYDGFEATNEYKQLVAKVNFVQRLQIAQLAKRPLTKELTGMTKEEIEEIASQVGYEIQESDLDTSQQSQSPSDVSKSEYMRAWLSFQMTDELLHKTEDIKACAIRENIIPDENEIGHDSAWRMMKNIASEIGVSSASPRGYWKQSEQSKFVSQTTTIQILPF